MNDSGYVKGACLQCGGHIEFPAEAAGTQIECPHCRWTTEIQPSDASVLSSPDTPELGPVPKRGPGRWLLAAGALSILIVAGLAMYLKRPGLFGSPLATNAPALLETAPAVPTPEGLVVSTLNLEATQGTSLIHARGMVENRSGRPRFGLKIEIQMLDAQGAPLGLGSDYVDVLEPGARWAFKALVIEPKTTRAVLHALVEEK